MGIYTTDSGLEKSLQTLAREDMKRRILADILIDMQVCQIEGRDIFEYVREIKNMIDSIYFSHKQ